MCSLGALGTRHRVCGSRDRALPPLQRRSAVSGAEALCTSAADSKKRSRDLLTVMGTACTSSNPAWMRWKFASPRQTYNTNGKRVLFKLQASNCSTSGCCVVAQNYCLVKMHKPAMDLMLTRFFQVFFGFHAREISTKSNSLHALQL
jgi:hypothetical protein